MADPTVLVAAITTGGGIIATLITIFVRNEKKRKDSIKPPKDRTETLFDGYENFITRQDKALQDKEKQLASQQIIIDKLQEQVNGLQELLRQQKEETERERILNRKLHAQLESMRKQYTDNKENKNGTSTK